METDPVQILSPDQVFKFVSAEIFKDTLAKDHLLTHLFHCANEYKEEVIKILRVVLPKFHKGFDKQKGAIFGFGETAKDDTGPVLKICELEDKSVLANALVTNLGEERNVGNMNYELNFRGREHFKTSTQNVVLNKSIDLITDFSNLSKFRRQAKDIEDLKQKWNKNMQDLEQQGLLDKEAKSLTEEHKKLNDLKYLKSQNPTGPFTSVEEVDNFMKNSNLSDAEKNHRLYIEVRYAKMSTSNMKRSSALFRLKKNYANLSCEDYAHNLRLYFGCVNSISTITRDDFSYILTGLNAALNTDNDSPEVLLQPYQESQNHTLKIGSHIAAVWSNEADSTGKTLTWYLGSVQSVSESGAMVSYMIQTNQNDKIHWMYPETSSTHINYYTPFEQILENDLPVKYSCVTIIRCQIKPETIIHLNQKLEEYVKKQNT